MATFKKGLKGGNIMTDAEKLNALKAIVAEEIAIDSTLTDAANNICCNVFL